MNLNLTKGLNIISVSTLVGLALAHAGHSGGHTHQVSPYGVTHTVTNGRDSTGHSHYAVDTYDHTHQEPSPEEYEYLLELNDPWGGKFSEYT